MTDVDADNAVIIVGTGLAGYNLARELRKRDPQVPMVLISRDSGDFYSKPMLSNALAGGKTPASLVMKSAEKMAAELGATVLAHTAVDAIEPSSRRLRCRVDGQARDFTYKALVLALGADPVVLPLAGDAAGAVLSVNDLADFAQFAQQLEQTAGGQGSQRIAILGAGLIGCEFANDLLARGIEPVVVDIADRPLSRLLPPQAGDEMQRKLTAAGVQFRLGVSALGVHRAGDRLKVALSSGDDLVVDVVLSAVGLQPRTQLAQQAGLAVARGIVVGNDLQTSTENIYAIGDCAEVQGWVLPYVMPLMAQARALAATLSGQPTAVTYPAMPVVVKTPACPTVVCPPPPSVAGQWSVTTDDEGLVGRFEGGTTEGPLLGFVLQGKAVSQRQTLAQQVTAWMV